MIVTTSAPFHLVPVTVPHCSNAESISKLAPQIIDRLDRWPLKILEWLIIKSDNLLHHSVVNRDISIPASRAIKGSPGLCLLTETSNRQLGDEAVSNLRTIVVRSHSLAEGGVADTVAAKYVLNFGGADLVDDLLADDVHVDGYASEVVEV